MASIPSNYEINVAKKAHGCAYGRHYCRIELGQMLPDEAKAKFRELSELFGEEYNLSLTYWKCYGEPVMEYSFGKITCTKHV